ncbi:MULTISPECIES: DUF1684 domain-containing protein [Streptomyces]|uniref:DUF1684 domain-containing protein n=1 Tax=Streptomyces luteosporeus TaxID=173856 RepID=A0ABN3U2G2_9ACTN
MSTSEAHRQWQQWCEQRTGTVAAPYGPLSLTGTHWLPDLPDGRIPAIPGQWSEAPEGDGVLLRARTEDDLVVDGKPFTGETVLAADPSPEAAKVASGERKLLVMHREGVWAVRVFDPGSARRRAFAGIDVFPYDERWVLPGRFCPYERDQRITVENADGRARGLALAGELVIGPAAPDGAPAGVPHGREFALRVAAEADGALWGVFADGTSGVSGYRFRFLRPGVPDADGRLTVDLNRALLPPCAFADHFICPLPPPGNRLPFAVEAGERNPLAH